MHRMFSCLYFVFALIMVERWCVVRHGGGGGVRVCACVCRFCEGFVANLGWFDVIFGCRKVDVDVRFDNGDGVARLNIEHVQAKLL